MTPELFSQAEYAAISGNNNNSCSNDFKTMIFNSGYPF